MSESEPALIGDELYEESFERVPNDMNEGALYWEAGRLAPIFLAGTDLPGNIHFDLGELALGPWFDRDNWDERLASYLSWTPPDPLAIVEQIFGDYGRPPKEKP